MSRAAYDENCAEYISSGRSSPQTIPRPLARDDDDDSAAMSRWPRAMNSHTLSQSCPTAAFPSHIVRHRQLAACREAPVVLYTRAERRPFLLHFRGVRYYTWRAREKRGSKSVHPGKRAGVLCSWKTKCLWPIYRKAGPRGSREAYIYVCGYTILSAHWTRLVIVTQRFFRRSCSDCTEMLFIDDVNMILGFWVMWREVSGVAWCIWETSTMLARSDDWWVKM